jgi:hypothetical protein
MSEWTTPEPTISEETAPFWAATKEHRFLLQRCADCGEVQYYYRGFCAACWSTDVEDVPAAGDGTVWSFSIIHKNRAPGFDRMLPYVVAMIELAEGVKICCRVELEDPEAVSVGMPVMLGYADATDAFSLPLAYPAEAGA